MICLVIPEKGPVREVELTGDGDLKVLQELVGGYIQAVPLPAFIQSADRATAYVNEEGKFSLERNRRATDFMVPGIGLFFGDWVAGPLVVCGFDPATGEHAELPADVVARVRLIESEAA